MVRLFQNLRPPCAFASLWRGFHSRQQSCTNIDSGWRVMANHTSTRDLPLHRQEKRCPSEWNEYSPILNPVI